ncbi:endonuclease/exonuclease/phosphatase family protein [Cellulomonas cellasea]|uniref:Endonuclease/exonuclease/phosphatase family metal-dependent hydrolase n=1 Tax=Cellulomonas cellasea TaxID=43670 RepID=A0A7W4YBE8_9CELL|nr:endonuclease/exonuclease/phosphatase family protein [Cellulomonas cellasea]MBB2923830.1 endonuclease/exonuclease/phosphatase family metal-dependent hydrolase [Cellulomonas cellasea]
MPAPAPVPPSRPQPPAHPWTLPPELGTPTRVSLLAVLTVLTVELLRAAGPLLDRTLPDPLAVGGTALGTYAAAGLVAALLLTLSARRTPGVPDGATVLAGTLVLGVARLVLQALDGAPRFVVGLVSVAIAVAVLTLAVAFTAGRPAGGRHAALGLVLGCGLASGLQLALGTWDAVWRDGVLGWLVPAVLVALAVVLARAAREDEPTGRPRRLWSLGPFLALVTLLLANPASVASQSHATLGVAGLVLVAASTVTVWVLLNPHLLVGPVRVVAAVVLPVAVLVAFGVTGPVVLVAAALAVVAAGVVVASATSTRRSAPPGLTGTAFVTAGVGLGLVATLLLYLVDQEVPLPVDNAVVPLLAAVAVALAGLRRRTPAPPGVDPAGRARAAGTTGPSATTAATLPAPLGAPTTVSESATTPGATSPAGPVASDGTLREDSPPFRANAVRLLAIPGVVLALVGWWPAAEAPPGPDRARGDELVVLSWNLHYGVTPGDGVELERVARTIEAQDPDVVALQEVARGWVLGGGVDTATWLSHRLGMDLEFTGAADPQFGNALLSRSTLTDERRTPLPRGDGAQDRVALGATVVLADGTPVRVTSVHLHYRSDDDATRLDQLDALAADLPDDGAAVLAGDLNAHPGSDELARLDADGWVTDPGPWAGTWPAPDATDRIDWVHVRGAELGSTEVVTSARTSDHLPVVARVVPTS